MTEKLAKITDCKLSFTNYNKILILDIVVEYDDFGEQNICNMCLDTYNKEKDKREGTAAGLELIRRVLDMFDCNNLSDIEGKVIYVLGEGDGLSFKPKGFKRPNFDNGKKLIYSEVFEDFK